MSAFLSKSKKLHVFSFTAFFIVSLALHATEQNENSMITLNAERVNARYSAFRNLSQMITDTDKKALYDQIYQSSELLLMEYEAAPPAGGNNLVLLNNNPSTTFYVAVNNSNDNTQWINFISQTFATWTSTANNNFTINPGFNTIPLPASSGSSRVYISTQQITGGNPPDVNSNFVWDLLEYNTGGTWDTSCVDAVGIPMALNYNGFIVGFRQYPRNFLMSQFSNMPSPFSLGVSSNRILSPKHCVPSNTTYLDTAITEGLQALAIQNPTITSGEFTFINFAYTPGSGSYPLGTISANSGADTYIVGGAVTGPFTSFSVLATAMIEPNDASGRLTAILETMINRGIVYDSTQWGLAGGTTLGFPWDYYVDNALKNNNTYSQYSKIIHQWCYNAMNYGLDHDDIYNQSSSITVPVGATAYLYIPVLTGNTPSPVPQPNSWDSSHRYYTTFGVPANLFTSLGLVVVNSGQWVLPDPTNASFPCTGLPVTFNIQFTNYPNSHISITLDGNGGGTVNNSGDWTGGISISGYNIAFPANLAPN